MKPLTPLHHLVRVRSSDDLTFVRAGLMDEVYINANQLENSAQGTAAALWSSRLPFGVDPVLWRFQVPQWWRNAKGETKRNYRRLKAEYTRGTRIKLEDGPLTDTGVTDEDWETLARNVVHYQQSRLAHVPAQLELLTLEQPDILRPARLVAPALVAYGQREDRINRILAEASAAASDGNVSAQLIIPIERLLDPSELARVLASTPTDGVAAYLVWIPEMTEEVLQGRHDVFKAFLHCVSSLASRGIAVGHQYANYTTFALRHAGISAVAHDLGWVDKGAPALESRFVTRSCRTYVPGVRHTLRFHEADDIGRLLDAQEYADRYCECTFCLGIFEAGEHPLDVLLEEQVIQTRRARRTTPTSRAVAANTWHYLLSRRLEIEAFSHTPAIDVIRHDIERAASLAGRRDRVRLERLERELISA